MAAAQEKLTPAEVESAVEAAHEERGKSVIHFRCPVEIDREFRRLCLSLGGSLAKHQSAALAAYLPVLRRLCSAKGVNV